MKKYIRATKRLNRQLFSSLRRYGWRDNDLIMLEQFAQKLGADIEYVGNGYIKISWNGESLGKFIVYNQHKYIKYLAGGVGGVLETSGNTIQEIIHKATDIISRDPRYSHLIERTSL